MRRTGRIRKEEKEEEIMKEDIMITLIVKRFYNVISACCYLKLSSHSYEAESEASYVANSAWLLLML